MMQDPDANFFEIQRAFNSYFENRDINNSPGYKQFKRWEYYTEGLVDSDGKISSLREEYNRFKSYFKKYPRSLKSGSVWTEIGPRILGTTNGMGRVNAIAFHPTDENIFFVGVPTGGIWVTYDGGINWETYTDELPIRGVSAIKVNYINPDTMYMGSGDREYSANGMGVMKSIDGGLTWEFKDTGMGNACVNMMVMHETDPNIIIAATNQGIYKTTDGAERWSLKKGTNFKDIKYKPGDMNVVYATKKTSSGSGFYKSVNGGNSWVRKGLGVLPHSSSTRMVIGVSPANNNIVYVACDEGKFAGLFESRDSGETFTKKSDSPNIMGRSQTGDDETSQGWYNFCIAVDQTDESNILIGGIYLWKSTDNGVTWSFTGNSNVHVDHHSFEFSPVNGKLYNGNDGGVYITENMGQSWDELSDGLGISEVYRIAQSATWSDKVMNGYQDNGTKTYIGGLLTPWSQTGGGDGMECVIDFTNEEYSYSSSQHGPVSRWISNTYSGRLAGENVNGIDESGAWVTPFCLNESDPKTMLIGYKNVWRSKNIKVQNTNLVEWDRITYLLDTNNDNIRVVENSPANSDIFYFSRNKTLFRSDNIMDDSPDWVILTDSLPSSTSNSDPYAIEAHPYEENTLYISHNRNIYKSIDKGNNWEDISGSLPSTTFYDIAFDLSSTEGLYVSALNGVYFKEGPGIDWVFYGDGLPENAKVNEIEIYQDPESRENSRLRAGTYSRGLWEAPLGQFSGILPPYKLVAESGDGYVTLNWKEPFYNDDITGYNIYRDDEIITFSSLTEFTDISIANETQYKYYVTAVNNIGIESSQSNEVNAHPKGPKTIPYTEDFENGNGDWQYNNTIADWRLGIASDFMMEHNTANQTIFFGISSIQAGSGTHTTDTLISPIFDLSNYTNLTLSFDYVLRQFLDYDKLKVLYRPSNNVEWIEITDLPRSGGHWGSWTNYNLDLPLQAMTSTTQIAFQYDDSDVYAYGAGIDNVQIFENTSKVLDNKSISQLLIFPNPNEGEFEINLKNIRPGEIKIKVFSTDGKKIYDRLFLSDTEDFKTKIILSEQTKGIYQIMIQSGNNIYYRKITLL